MHCPSKIMQLATRLTTLLKLPLQPTKNMIESQPALPRQPDAPTAHTTQAQGIGGRIATLLLPSANENEGLWFDWLGCPAGPEGEDDAFWEPYWACGCWYCC